MSQTHHTSAHGTHQKPTQGTHSVGGQHTEHEDHPWEIDIPDHPQRTDSPTYLISRKLVNEICAQAGAIPTFLGGTGPYQDHHGGGMWVKDKAGWLFIKNLAGMEWSQQFCADPAKVEQLRQYAERIYDAFPNRFRRSGIF